MEFGVAETKAPRIAFVKRDLEVSLPRALAGEADQITGAIEPGDVGKAAPRQLERMSALATAQIEDAIVALEADTSDQELDLVGRVAIVFDYVAIGFEVEGVEKGAPPIRRQMTLEVRYGTQCPGADPPILLHLVRARTIRAGVDGLRLGSGPRAVGLLTHFDLPRGFRHQKRRLLDEEPRGDSASRMGRKQHRSRAAARWGGVMRRSVSGAGTGGQRAVRVSGLDRTIGVDYSVRLDERRDSARSSEESTPLSRRHFVRHGIV